MIFDCKKTLIRIVHHEEFLQKEGQRGPSDGWGQMSGIWRDLLALSLQRYASPGSRCTAAARAARATPPHPLDTCGGLRTNSSSLSFGSSFRNEKNDLRRSATEAQLGLAFEFESEIELHFEFQFKHEFEYELVFDSELRLEFEFEFEI